MRIRTLYTFFLLTWIAIGYLTPVTAQNTAESPTETDYFEQITLFSDGRITRFTRMPIRVHISPTLKALSYLAEIRYAMRTWETATDGKIRFEETEVSEMADIRVTETYSGRLSFLDTRLGSAELTRLTDSRRGEGASPAEVNSQKENFFPDNRQLTTDNQSADSQFTVEVILVLEGDGTTGELTQEEMRTVCLHEFGHAIGL